MSEILGVTAGDASGVGPEIVLKAYLENRLPTGLVVFGDLRVLEFYNRTLGYGVPLHTISAPVHLKPGVLNVIDHGIVDLVRPGILDEVSGRAARQYVIAAAQAALAGHIGAMVTLPMNKEATQLSDPGFVGHTELIGQVCGVSDVTIMLVSDALIVTHVSTHCSLAEAVARTRQPRIRTILSLTSSAVQKLVPDARIAVAGLNPHAGENGLFGREDIEEIAPAVEWAKAQGMPVSGPYPPDTLFYMAVRRKKFDAIVCMYHDQGHIPLKLLDFEGGVNVALGLPIIRTSVDHGTAFDIAGQGVAGAGSFEKAISLAIKMMGTARA